MHIFVFKVFYTYSCGLSNFVKLSRKDCNIISDFLVSDFISDHRALHASLQCIRHHPVRKQIAVRAIRRIKDDAIVKDLDKYSIDQRCVDAPLKKITVVDRPLKRVYD